MKIELIGEVGVDSGQLLLCDPCYIDSQWEKEEFEDIRIYKHKTTGKTLQYRKDFPNYEAVIPEYDKTMNQLNRTGEWEQDETTHQPKNSFSYNACCKKTLSSQTYGELEFKSGRSGAGVAFSTAFGDGVYPVYAVYGDDGSLLKVEVVFQEEQDQD